MNEYLRDVQVDPSYKGILLVDKLNGFFFEAIECIMVCGFCDGQYYVFFSLFIFFKNYGVHFDTSFSD